MTVTAEHPGGVVIPFPTPPGLHSPNQKGKQMPFGLQTKSLVVGLVLGALVVPRISAAIAAKTGK